MIPYEKALRIAQNEIFEQNLEYQLRGKRKLEKNKGLSKKEKEAFEIDKLILIEESIIEKEFGWIFYYNSKKATAYYKKNPNTRILCGYEIGGNAPFIVDKFTEKIHYTGTGDSIDFYIEAYEKKESYWRLVCERTLFNDIKNLSALKKVFNFENKDLISLKKSKNKLVILEISGKRALINYKAELIENNVKSKIQWNRE
jgi:hypothetical protein